MYLNTIMRVLTAPSIKKAICIRKKSYGLETIQVKLFPSKPKVNFRFAKEKHKVKSNLTQYDILIDDKASTIDSGNQQEELVYCLRLHPKLLRH